MSSFYCSPPTLLFCLYLLTLFSLFTHLGIQSLLKGVSSVVVLSLTEEGLRTETFQDIVSNIATTTKFTISSD